MAKGDTDVFNEVEDESEEAVEEKVETESESEEETDAEKGETEEESEEQSEEESEEEESPSSKDDPKTVAGLKAALVAERKKSRSRNAEQEAAKAPDPNDDPEGYEAHVQAGVQKLKVEMSQEMARDKHDDYDEMEEVFKQLIYETDDDGKFVGDKESGKAIVADARLVRQFQQSKNPAEFAYKYVKKHLDLQTKSDPDYESNLETRLRKKILAEIDEGGLDALDVPDLTNAAASGSNHGLEEPGDPDHIDAFDDA